MNHTPVPWRYVETDNIIVSDAVRVADVNRSCGTSRLPLSDIVPRSLDVAIEERNANAEFIVKACNAYGDLLEALEAMLHRFDHLDTDAGKREACEAARAAIAKAKGTA